MNRLFRPEGLLLALLLLLVPPTFAQTAFAVRHARAGGDFLWGIASGPSGLVVVGERGTVLASADGAAWMRRDAGVSDWLLAITYAQGRFVIVGDRGTILTSTDGITWMRMPPVTDQRLNGITYGGGQFVAVGEAGTILTSPNGLNWTRRESGATGWLRGVHVISEAVSGIVGGGTPQSRMVTFSQSLYFAAGQGGVLLASGDGVTWGRSTPWGTSDIEALAGYELTAVGQNGGYWRRYIYNAELSPFITASVPRVAVGFSTENIGATARLRGLITGPGVTYVTGENGTVLSPGYPAWVRHETGTTANLVAGSYVGNSLFAVGENETILQSTPVYFSRLGNLSTRGRAGAGAETLTSGFVVGGTAPRRVLVRAAGPALRGFGLSDALATPTLTVLDATGRALGSNAGWANSASLASAAAQVGAFPYATGSADSALLLTLEPGNYTAQVSSAGAAGPALVECYDADDFGDNRARMINISTRAFVGGGNDVLIAGLNLGGAGSRRVLIRAVGPSLQSFGISGTLAEPMVEIYYRDERTPFMALRGGWSTLNASAQDELRGNAVFAGAFPLREGSKDIAAIVTLAPASYTLVVRGQNGTTGIALVEVYDFP